MAIKAYSSKIIFLTFLFSNVYGGTEPLRYTPAIDPNIFEEILDAEQCDKQVQYIKSNSLLGLQFADAGIRTPRGILTGNTVDFGNYHQCLGINHQFEDMEIEGKYCSILVPFNQSLQIPLFQGVQDISLFNHNAETSEMVDDNFIMDLFEEFDIDRKRTMPETILSSRTFRVAVCVPKPCSTQQAITSLLFNITELGFQYTEDFCRIPNDKPWVTADTLTVIVFSVIGLLAVSSTMYDISVRFIFKNDPSEINPTYQSFSVYTNGQRLMNFSAASSLQCIDGIRTIAMMWVIVGHTFVTEDFTVNINDVGMWFMSANGLWITSATMTVDTFFALSGILLVYTTVGKMKSSTFLKNLHWFYLNRIVRIYPLMAMVILLQASFMNRAFDGPLWGFVEDVTNRCRRNWLLTLSNVQSYIIPRSETCNSHLWYVAIDMQLYFFSPVILYWVFMGKRKIAWTALFTALIAVQIMATIYNFMQNFQAGTFVPSRPGSDWAHYMQWYYYKALTRAAPFFVGMIFGYLLHTCRGKKVQLSRILVTFLWLCTIVTVGTILYGKYCIKQLNWDNQLVDNLMNSFMRPMWAAALCWLIFACVHGYSGPINWFLSLDIWRLPARLSYGMYLFHYPLMFSINASAVAPVYFSVARYLFKYLSYQVLSFIVSFILTLLIDAPISLLFKRLIDTVQKKRKPAAVRDDDYKKEDPTSGMTSTDTRIDVHKTQ